MFGWKILPGHTTLDLLHEFQVLMENELKVQPQQIEDHIIFMSMYNDIDWTRKGNQQVCEENSSCVADYARHFCKGHWSFFGPNGAWNRVAVQLMISFAESGRPLTEERRRYITIRNRKLQSYYYVPMLASIS